MSEKDISLTVADAFETVIDDKIDGHIRQDNTSHLAEVVRIDPDGTHWVHVYGGADLTPVTNLASTAQVGDVINVTISNNSILGMGNISSPAPTKTYVDKQNTGVIQIVGNAIGADLSGLSYKDGILKSEKVVTDKLQARVGEFQQAIADRLEVKRANIEYAKIDAANITAAQVKTAWIDKLLVDTDLLAKEGTIYKLEAVEVDATNITAGTLDVNRLIITQEDQQGNVQKYLVHYEIPPGGTEPQPVVEKLDGNIIEPRTVTADRMVANTITVNEITAQNLQGINGWINLTQGTFQYGQDPTLGNNGIWWDGTDLHIHANEITSIVGDVDDLEAMVHQYGQGVLVCRPGQTVGALVNANGSFDAVSVTWSNGVPTVGAVLATFGANGATIGKTSTSHIQIDSNSVDIWDANNAHHLVEMGGETRTYEETSYYDSYINLGGSSRSIRANDDRLDVAAENGWLAIHSDNTSTGINSQLLLSPTMFQLAANTLKYVIVTDNFYERLAFIAPHMNFESDNFSLNDTGVVTLGTNTSGESNGIRVKGGGKRNAWLLRNISASNGDGDAVLLGNGGATIVGSGESADNLWSNLGISAGTEQLHLASDGNVYIWSNANTYANRAQTTFSTTNSGSYPQTLAINNGLNSPLAVSNNANNGWTTTDSNATYSSVQLRDKNGYWTGVWGSYVVGSTSSTSHGANCTYIGARNKTTNNTDVANYINLYVRKDGTRTVSVSDASAWRSALGIGTSGAFPVTIAQGGTGKTNTDVTYYGYVSLWSGTATTGNITVSVNDMPKWEACTYLIIRFRDNENHYGSVMIRMGSSAVLATLSVNYASNGYAFIKSRTVSVSSGGISTVSGTTCDITVPGTSTNTTNHIYIVQVLGLK